MGMNEKKSLVNFLQLGFLEGIFVLLLLFIIFGTLVATNVIHISKTAFPSFFGPKGPSSSQQIKTPPNKDPFTKEYDAQKAQRLLYNFISQQVNPLYVPSPMPSVEQNFYVVNGAVTHANEFVMNWTKNTKSFSAMIDYVIGTNTPSKIILFVNNLLLDKATPNLLASEQNTMQLYFKKVSPHESCSKYTPSLSYCQISPTSASDSEYGAYILGNNNLKVYACKLYVPGNESTPAQCVVLGL